MPNGEPCKPIVPINYAHYISMLRQFKFNYRRKLVPLKENK